MQSSFRGRTANRERFREAQRDAAYAHARIARLGNRTAQLETAAVMTTLVRPPAITIQPSEPVPTDLPERRTAMVHMMGTNESVFSVTDPVKYPDVIARGLYT